MSTHRGALSAVPGMFSIVLHTHLPWFAHHGVWPVGEELLYQCWASSYIPLMEELRILQSEGYRHILTLGVTPIVAAQLDDPYCREGMEKWLAHYRLRTGEALSWEGDSRPGRADDRDALRKMGERERDWVTTIHRLFRTYWAQGGSSVIRRLSDGGAIEVLGGPLAHPFQPLLPRSLRRFFLESGLEDGALRWGRRSTGLWAPECAYTPGMEVDYAQCGITHCVVDGPALHGDTALGRPLLSEETSEPSVVAFGRDLTVSYRVWSPKAGYPGAADYRDFHTYHHETGFKPARVTGRRTPPEEKAPYDPQRAALRCAQDVEDFVDLVCSRLHEESQRLGRPAHVVAAFDTELFGHWWYEGPQWFSQVIRRLTDRGVHIGTLSDALDQGYVGEPVRLERCSWGSGKDWRVWTGDAVADVVAMNTEICEELEAFLRRSLPDRSTPVRPRSFYSDQVVREAALALQSDWAFLISKNTAADYARQRYYLHAHAMRELIHAWDHGSAEEQQQLWANWHYADGPFPQLDARELRDSIEDDTGH